MGSEAVRVLVERIDGRTNVVQLKTAPTLVVRRTTAPPP
jgi:DNA-binding LacI/PurR family transcriptional regulator